MRGRARLASLRRHGWRLTIGAREAPIEHAGARFALVLALEQRPLAAFIAPANARLGGVDIEDYPVAFDAVDCTRVRFRPLARTEIERYVDAEQPFDCAGSFKSEGLGIALFDAIETQDPTALIGLPMIATARLLRSAGFPLP